MTTIGIAPTEKTRDWFVPDSATSHEFLSYDQVATSDTLAPELRHLPHSSRVVQVQLEWGGPVALLDAVWFQNTIDALGALPWHTDHWSSGATRTQPVAIAKLLQILLEVLDAQSPAPQVVPTWRGGVQAEWHCNDVDFEIEVDPRGHVDYFFKSPDKELEGRVGHPSQLAVYARAVVQS